MILAVMLHLWRCTHLFPPRGNGWQGPFDIGSFGLYLKIMVRLSAISVVFTFE